MKVVQKLDPNKAHRQNKISICMIKICGKSICKPLCKFFKESLRTSTFLFEWKRGTIVIIFKKRDNKFRKLSARFGSANFWKNSSKTYF